MTVKKFIFILSTVVIVVFSIGFYIGEQTGIASQKLVPPVELSVTPSLSPTPIISDITNAPTVSPLIHFDTALVTKVIDGDTIEIEDSRTVRYIGMDTPETKHPTKPVECFGQEASNKNQELVLGKIVKLEKDISETDQYGRLLRYVYVDDLMVNEYLVQEGYASVSTFPPDVKYQSRFQAAENAARTNNKGLWNESACPQEEGTRFDIQPSPSGTCLIKGNISFTTGDKIYHLPGCPYYDTTAISLDKGEKYFCSEEEAVQAGWRKAKNC